MRKLLKNAVTVLALSGLPFGLCCHLRAQERVGTPLISAARTNALVPTCANVQLTATYLASSAAQGGPPFQFSVHNGTDRAISLLMPAPTSAHWYAREGSRWLWRASNGAGGSPVDAMNPHGRMFAFPAQPQDQIPNQPQSRARNQTQNQTKISSPPAASKLMVAAHSFETWEMKPAENPVLTFKPSCARCNHPTDRDFRVVFAYAVLPQGNETAPEQDGMLRCGLRTTPVPVPGSYADRYPGRSAESKLSLPRIAAPRN